MLAFALFPLISVVVLGGIIPRDDSVGSTNGVSGAGGAPTELSIGSPLSSDVVSNSGIPQPSGGVGTPSFGSAAPLQPTDGGSSGTQGFQTSLASALPSPGIPSFGSAAP